MKLTLEQMRDAYEKGFRVVVITPNAVYMYRTRKEYGQAVSKREFGTQNIAFSIRNMFGFANY